MRDARAGDMWRAISKKGIAHNRITSIDATHLPNTPTTPILIKGPITAIAGLNGVGKSTLLHCIGELLGIDSSVISDDVAHQIGAGDLKISLMYKGEEIWVENGKEKPELPPSTWINSAVDVPIITARFRKETNLAELLEQFEAIDYDYDEVKQLSWMVGKTYDSCRLYEIEDIFPTPVPYFKVVANGVEYGSETMGLGEAAIHYICWQLRRVRRGSVILLEEPESYVSSRSQAAIINRLAEVCVTEGCSAILTTHSSQIVSKIPPAWCVVLSSIKSGATWAVPKSSDGLAEVLGMPPIHEKKGIIVVEDLAALLFCKQWVIHFKWDFFKNWRITTVNGVGDILKSVENFPDCKGWFRIVGVLDAEEKAKKHQIDGLAVCYLPGDDPPDMLLRKSILNDLPSFVNRLSLDSDEVTQKVASLDGLDHHEWFNELLSWCSSRNIGAEQVANVGFTLWREMEENEKIASSCFNEFMTVASRA